jgi:hypothetical protein
MNHIRRRVDIPNCAPLSNPDLTAQTRGVRMAGRIRDVAPVIAIALALLPFSSGIAAAAPAPSEPNSYTLSRGASVDRRAATGDKDVANRSAQPPPCVTAGLDPRGVVTQTIHVRNGCAAQQRVKIIVAFGFDSPCFILDPGASVAHAMDTGLPRAYFDGLEAC